MASRVKNGQNLLKPPGTPSRVFVGLLWLQNVQVVVVCDVARHSEWLWRSACGAPLVADPRVVTGLRRGQEQLASSSRHDTDYDTR